MTHSFPTRRSSDLSLRRRKIRTVLRQAQHKRKRGRVSFARHERKDEARHALAMRPEILNPLFAALTDLKGVGPQLAKPLTRLRSEEHTSELQSLMRISYAVFCLKKKHNVKYYTNNS